MPTLRDVLQRFRPAGVPGAAAPAGVPADRAAEAEAELAPLFAALDPTQAECRSIRERAETDARRGIEHGRAEATAALAEARAGADEERARATENARERRSGEHAAVLAAADREAERIRAQTRDRLPGAVDRVLTVLEEGLG